MRMFEKFFHNQNQIDQFQVLYHDNFNYIYSFVFIRTSCDSSLTEEIVQETFVEAWRSQDRFQNRSTYRTWLCGIAKNKLYEHYRKRSFYDKRQFYELENLIDFPSDYDLEGIVLKNETKEHVAEALNQIAPLYRYTLIMKYIDGYSVKEIAGNLGRTQKAIDGILQRAKRNFIREFVQIEEREDYHE